MGAAVSDLSVDQEIGQNKNKETGSPFRKNSRRSCFVAPGEKLTQEQTSKATSLDDEKGAGRASAQAQEAGFAFQERKASGAPGQA